MSAKEFLKEIRDLIDLVDGERDAEGNPVTPPSYEKLDELVTEIYGLCECALKEAG
jgi:hypothetical protein